ncbi:enoyl-CoA hydratase [Gordonia jinghuaiqii]|uniref:Enoyl-CoA hydratase/isomerase family protein n=1 Tax=Gordonia jinghuaiqii TaxID=2758710 RepID=A0A7D7QRC6_9ACTN|nr:enoyl-CoA hydratase-related protein [Gordonia jinghuaiqii]MCR5978383.1 enoyl-CoA hydratase [Gordonia jinghuaiqii]QMT02726.1 enoyl-CoA hydratase/isomerase family protein [Gordonia jinghuaiqii]
MAAVAQERFSELTYSVTDGIGTITLNRPSRKNAFTLEMVDAWATALRSARTDPEVRVVLVTGSSGSFCAGVDLEDFSQVTTTLGRFEVLQDRVHRVAAASLELDKPLVAAIDGVAVGAGMDMALACDIRLASTRARFCESYIRVGLLPGDGGAHLLPRIVGQARALELLWTGRWVDATEALELGIVTSLHEPDALADAAGALCRRLADAPPVAVRAIKRLVRNGERVDFATSLDMVAAEQAVVQSTEDSTEAMAAFREGRRPSFSGK